MLSFSPVRNVYFGAVAFSQSSRPGGENRATKLIWQYYRCNAPKAFQFCSFTTPHPTPQLHTANCTGKSKSIMSRLSSTTIF